MAMQKNDVPPEKVKGLSDGDTMVQFFVRVEVRTTYLQSNCTLVTQICVFFTIELSLVVDVCMCLYICRGRSTPILTQS